MTSDSQHVLISGVRASASSVACRALRVAVLALIAATTLAWQGCGGSSDSGADDAPTVVLPSKALWLTVSASGAVIAETGDGLYTLPNSKDRRARRLTAVLGTVPIANTLTIAPTKDGALLGSSHPDSNDARIPSDLGLLISNDQGQTWKSVSLYGSADLHIMRAAGASLYAVDTSRVPLRLRVTTDYGRSWASRKPPGAISDMAVNPKDPTHLLATTDKGLLASRNQAISWRPGGADAEALAWPAGSPLYTGAPTARSTPSPAETAPLSYEATSGPV